MNPKVKLDSPQSCYVKSIETSLLEDENFDILTSQMRLKENTLCGDLMAYLRDLMEFSYENPKSLVLTPTRPVDPDFELQVVRNYLEILKALRDDRFEGL